MAITKAAGAVASGVSSVKRGGAGGSGSNGAQLRKIQQVLLECWELENRISEIPVLIEEKRTSLKTKKAQLLSEMERIKKVNEYLKDNKAKLDDVIGRREEAEGKLEKVSTQREFDVENDIVEKCREDERRIRANMANLEKRNEASRARAKEMEEEIAAIESVIDGEISALEQELEQKTSENVKALERRRKISDKVDQNLLYKFDRIIRNKGGLASVGLRSGVCQGCHMQLPDQFVNTVRENKEMQFCPYCSRILVYEDSKDDEEIIESNLKYNDSRQSDEDERELEEASLVDDIQAEDEVVSAAPVPDDGLDDDEDGIEAIAGKDPIADAALIADESEFDL